MTYKKIYMTFKIKRHMHARVIFRCVLMYRKTEQSTGMGKSAPIDIPKKLVSQSSAKGNPNPRLETQERRETPAQQPKLPIKTPPGQNLPRQGRKDGGANPMHREGPSTENQKGLGTLFSTHDYISLVLETKEEEDGGGTIEGSGESAPSTRREDERERPLLQEEKSDQSLGEPINLLQSILVFFHISQGRIEELTGLLSEMSGTPITMEMTCKWLDLEPQPDDEGDPLWLTNQEFDRWPHRRPRG